jgi:hypothetical protein
MTTKTEATKPKTKQVVVESFNEMATLIEGGVLDVNGRKKKVKSVFDKYPETTFEFWLDDDPDKEMKLIGRVSPCDPSKAKKKA